MHGQYLNMELEIESFVYKFKHLKNLGRSAKLSLTSCNGKVSLNLSVDVDCRDCRASVSTQANVFEQQHGDHQASFGNENYDTMYEMIRQSMDEDGINRDLMFNQVRTKMSVDEMDDAIDFLTNEGHIYSTRDEDHFRITDTVIDYAKDATRNLVNANGETNYLFI